MAQRTFSYKQYRAADLTIFALILGVFEAVIGVLARQWADTLYFVSLFYAVSALVIMRWGAWGALHCALGGIVFCAANGNADIFQYLAYTIGNCFALMSLLLRDIVGKKKVRDNIWLTLCFVVIIWISVCLGRTLLLSVFKQQNFFELFSVMMSTEALSAVIALVVVFISRRQNGLFEDQKEYLLRTEEERKKALQNSNTEN